MHTAARLACDEKAATRLLPPARPCPARFCSPRLCLQKSADILRGVFGGAWSGRCLIGQWFAPFPLRTLPGRGQKTNEERWDDPPFFQAVRDVPLPWPGY